MITTDIKKVFTGDLSVLDTIDSDDSTLCRGASNLAAWGIKRNGFRSFVGLLRLVRVKILKLVTSWLSDKSPVTEERPK